MNLLLDGDALGTGVNGGVRPLRATVALHDEGNRFLPAMTPHCW